MSMCSQLLSIRQSILCTLRKSSRRRIVGTRWSSLCRWWSRHRIPMRHLGLCQRTGVAQDGAEQHTNCLRADHGVGVPAEGRLLGPGQDCRRSRRRSGSGCGRGRGRRTRIDSSASTRSGDGAPRPGDHLEIRGLRVCEDWEDGGAGSSVGVGEKGAGGEKRRLSPSRRTPYETGNALEALHQVGSLRTRAWRASIGRGLRLCSARAPERFGAPATAAWPRAPKNILPKTRLDAQQQSSARHDDATSSVVCHGRGWPARLQPSLATAGVSLLPQGAHRSASSEASCTASRAFRCHSSMVSIAPSSRVSQPLSCSAVLRTRTLLRSAGTCDIWPWPHHAFASSTSSSRGVSVVWNVESGSGRGCRSVGGHESRSRPDESRYR